MKSFLQESIEMAKNVLDGICCVLLLIFFCAVVISLLYAAGSEFAHGHWAWGVFELFFNFVFAVITLTFARRKGWY